MFCFSGGGPVVCEAESNDQSEKHTAHCHVNHSSNAVAVFSCAASATTDEVHSDVRAVNASECAYDKMLYNITTFTVHTIDHVTSLMCTVRYTANTNASVVYYEEQFVVFFGSNKIQPTHDTGYFYFLPSK